MATYKEVKGVTVQTLSEDPVVGGLPGATWASGNAVPASAYYWGSAGTQTSNIIAGGYGPSGVVNTSFQYNGTDWTSAPNINEAREMLAGFGASSTAALVVAGAAGAPFVGSTEQFDGSSWAEKADLTTTRIQGAAAGTSYTSGIYFGGRTPPNTRKDETEEWNGSTWTERGDLNSVIKGSAGFGTTTAAISAGGDLPPATQSGVESWNGSAWTELSGTLNSGRNAMAVSGTQTAGLVFGGSPPITTKTEAWNGTTFTEVNDMSNALYGRGGSPAGTQTAALASGGQPSSPSPTNFTEEFSAAPVTAAILTEGSVFLSGGQTLKGFGKAAGLPAGAWSSQTNINTARGLGAGCGTQDSALIYGGFTSPPSTAYAQTEEWNGSTWTEKGDLNVPFYYIDAGGLGTVTAALAHGGEGPSGGTGGETFNGSSWAEISNSNSNHIKAGGAGSSTAGLSIGSYPPTSPNEQVEEWDGSSWTEIADLNEGRGDGCGSGTSISAWFCGGEAPGNSAKTEVWDGTSWTESGDLNTARYSHRGSGANQNDGLVYGGNGVTNKTELWNGSTWTEVSDLATARQNIQSSGGNASSAVSALASGGYNAGTNAVEEFVVDNTLSTVTVS